MDEREIISRAIHFGKPPRIGLRYGRDFQRSDVVDVGYSEPGLREGNVDEWGCVWKMSPGEVFRSLGQVVKHPLEEWREYNGPDPDRQGRYDNFGQLDRHPNKYWAGSFPFPVFNRLMFLRGIRNLMMDFYYNQNRIRNLAGKILDFDKAIIGGYAKFGLDGVWFGDDLGSQKGLLFSPQIWREFLFPWYKELFDQVHCLGMDVIFHTCGQTRRILGDIVNLGADALNLNQVDLIGVDWLRERFAGKVAFWCPVDVQRMDDMSIEQVGESASRLVTSLGTENGGFIALCDEGLDHGTVSNDKIKAMGDAFEKYRS